MELSPGSRHGSGDAPEVRAPRPAAATVAPRWKRPRRRRLRAGRGRDPAAHQRPAAGALCRPRRRGAAGRVARGRRGLCCALSRLPGCDRRRAGRGRLVPGAPIPRPRRPRVSASGALPVVPEIPRTQVGTEGTRLLGGGRKGSVPRLQEAPQREGSRCRRLRGARRT